MGAYYGMVGTDSFKNPSPPQGFRVLGPVEFRSELGPGMVKARRWVDLGKWGVVDQKVYLSLYEMNIPEHGEHGVHVFRMPGVVELYMWMKELNRKDDYSEISVTR